MPFLLRHGKRLKKRVTEVNVQFRTPPLHLFNRPDGVDDQEVRAAISAGMLCQLRPNVLTLRIQPEEQISLSFGVKQPGSDMVMSPAKLSFDYEEHFGASTAPAYERLLGDALNGDPTLFLRADEIEASWHFADEVRKGWSSSMCLCLNTNPHRGDRRTRVPCFTVVRVAGQIRDSGLIDSHFDSGLRAVNDGAVGPES